jgi:hypothetical protein
MQGRRIVCGLVVVGMVSMLDVGHAHAASTVTLDQLAAQVAELQGTVTTQEKQIAMQRRQLLRLQRHPVRSLPIRRTKAGKTVITGDVVVKNNLWVRGSAAVGHTLHDFTTRGKLAFGELVGSGAGLTKLDASALATGTLPNDRLSGTYDHVLSFKNAGNALAGDGTGLTGINAKGFAFDASQITSGTLPDDRLSGTYTHPLTLSSASNVLTGDGSALGGLDASKLTSGTVPDGRLGDLDAAKLTSGTLPDDRLSGTYTHALTLTNASNAFTGGGSGLGSLDASNLASGTLPNGRLSGTYSNALTLSSASNAFTGNGSGLGSLSASNLSSGTLPDGRLSGTYSNTLTFNNASNAFTGNGADLSKINASCVNHFQMVGHVATSDSSGIVNVAFPVQLFVGQTDFIALFDTNYTFKGVVTNVNAVNFVGLTPNTPYIVMAMGDC